jgi:hypothetical protein
VSYWDPAQLKPSRFARVASRHYAVSEISKQNLSKEKKEAITQAFLNTTKKPSVTKFNQIICAGKIGKGISKIVAPIIVKASPAPVENKYKIGITGSNGFVGKHLKNHLELYPEKYEIIPFERSNFEEDLHLDLFTSSCDVIIHLAAVNRSNDEAYLYDVNVSLAMKLSESLKRTSSKSRIIFSSSSQESSSSSH